MQDKEKEHLEALIDQHGLSAVIYAIAVICMEKAEHLSSNWQDKLSAAAWEADSLLVEKAAQTVTSS